MQDTSHSGYGAAPNPFAGKKHLLVPTLFLATFILGFAFNYAIPWLGVGGEGMESKWYWGHEMKDALRENFGSSDFPNPANYVMSGLIVGIGICGLWIALSMALPQHLFTPAREAGVIALLAIPLYLVLNGAASGFGDAMTINSGDTNRWAVSIAGIVILVAGLAGGAAMTWLLVRRLPMRRVPVFFLAATLLAATLMHAIPWATIHNDNVFGTRAATSSVWMDSIREGIAAGETNPMDYLAVGMLVTLILATLWVVSSAYLPDRARWIGLVDGLFAVLLIVPLCLFAYAVGTWNGYSWTRLFTTGKDWGFSWAAMIFLPLLAGLGWTVFDTLRVSLRKVEVGA